MADYSTGGPPARVVLVTVVRIRVEVLPGVLNAGIEAVYGQIQLIPYQSSPQDFENESWELVSLVVALALQ